MKKIVLEHPSGLHQIMDDWPEANGQPDAFLPLDAGVTIDGAPVAVNLVGCRRTYWLYRPVMVPAGLKAFDKEQR